MFRSVLVIGLIVGASVATAQSITRGAIQGRVVDARTGEPMASVSITITAGRDAIATRTGLDGTFRLSELVPGDYDVVLDDGSAHRVVRRGVRVGTLAVTNVYQAIDRSAPGTIEIDAPASVIDPSSMTIGFVADRRYLTDVPSHGRSFDSVMGAAPGGRSDGYGIAFAAGTSLDNRYVVDGMDTTDARQGFTGTFLPNEFLREVTVMTGGHFAEYGRSIGGTIVAVTRSGTNALRGSVFASLSPGFLQSEHRTARAPRTIDVSPKLGYDAGVGFELGGPLVKDRAWFYVGFAPQLSRFDYARTIQSRTDCRMRLAGGALSECEARFANGYADVDPSTGFEIVDPVDFEVRSATARSYPALAKVDFAIPQHQGMVSAIAVPWTSETPELYGAESVGRRGSGLSTDVSARWTSMLDEALRLDAGLGWHRARTNSASIDASFDTLSLTRRFVRDFSDLATVGTESAAAIEACSEGANDRFPLIDNCPLGTYSTGGPGLLQHDLEARRSMQLALTGLVSAAGRHELKAGFELEDASSDTAYLYSGGALIDEGFGFGRILRIANLAAADDPDPRFDQTCGDGVNTYRCQIVGGTPGAPGTMIDAQSIAWAAYLRDSWRLRSNVVVNAGLRYDSQRLKYPDDLRGRTHPLSGEHLGDNAIRLVGNVSPRLGVAYDPTNEGRAKLFAHWGRYYESLPTQIIDQYFARSAWITERPNGTELIGASLLPVDPKLEAGYVDEVIVGSQYEVSSDLTIGASWQHRELGRAIEDVALDSGVLALANPGYGSARDIGRAVRTYDLLALSIARRFSQLYVQGSYSYSRLVGNYTGTIGYDDRHFSPAHTSQQLDQRELTVNGMGPLPHDRPHHLKLDAAYSLRLNDRSDVVVGTRFRALSGTPLNAYGDWPYRYFLLPRGALGRGEFASGFDVRVAYRHRLGRGVMAEVFADLFNIFDEQSIFAVDSTYTGGLTTNTATIVGGTYADLIWLKTPGLRPTSVERNPNFGKSTSRYGSRYASLGARLTF